MVKRVLFFIFLINLSVDLFAQNNIIHNTQNITVAANGEWNLRNFLWGHDHSTRENFNKPLIDFDAIDNWVELGTDPSDLSISRNGEYFAYTINNARERRSDSLIVQSTTNSWRQEFAGGTPGFFSADSKQYIFQTKEGLCFLQTGSSQREYQKDVASFKVPVNGRNEWLAYQLKNKEATLVIKHLVTGKEERFNQVGSYNFHISGNWMTIQLKNDTKDLVLYNLITGTQRKYQWVADFTLGDNGKLLLLKTVKKTGNPVSTDLQLADLSIGTIADIWTSDDNNCDVTGFSIDGKNNQVVFIVSHAVSSDSSNFNKSKEKSTIPYGNSIWYWSLGANKAVLKASNETPGLAGVIQGTPFFTTDGQYIRFSVQTQLENLQPKQDAVQVDVWNYQDAMMQSAQANLTKEPKTRKAVLNIANRKVILLESENEDLRVIKGNYALIRKSGKVTSGDRFWQKDYLQDSTWLLSLQDGSRKLLEPRGGSDDIFFSPDGDHLVYFNGKKDGNYFSYDLRTGTVVNISDGVPANTLGNEDLFLSPSQEPNGLAGIAGWLNGGRELLVYDTYDIWQLDMTGKKKPANITNGYGRKHNIIFSLKTDRISIHFDILKEKDLLLTAFNTQNKYNGFYRKTLGTQRDPDLLYMGPCFMQGISTANVTGLIDGVRGIRPLKADDANVWIVQRQTDVDASNYFLTSDFKTYKRLTDLHPQKKYNWLTAELHSYKQLDGTISQGVLYKPENFDSHKKYPVIISFYAQLSDRLYQYPQASYLNAPHIFDDPAWIVSQGYLVFTPDIYFTKGKWGPSTVNTVDGAALYLNGLPFVDGNHLGAVGHSNSGRFGYYLFTHSSSFAAMSLGAGTTDVLSNALSEDGRLIDIENGQLGPGLGTLWQNKASWLDHTSVLNTDKAISPLLMFHCKNDGAPVEQAVQMFTSLRRIEKKAWWLQYDGEAHILFKQKNLRDFTIRYTQFFDHYLKGAPAPKWMTQGIPYKLKGIEARYELDAAGSCAMQGKNHCYVCEAWNKQYKRTPTMFEKEIKYWELDKDLKQELDRKTKAERAKLDKEQLVEDKKIVNILKYGYPEDKRSQKN